MFNQKREVIPFKEFLRPPAAIIPNRRPLTPIYSFFPPITIKSFFPIHDGGFSLFLLAGSVVVIIALADRFLMSTDCSAFGMYVSAFAKVAFPVVGFGAGLWLLTQL